METSHARIASISGVNAITLGASGITAIYATQYIRTQSTAAPLANYQGISIKQIDSRDRAELVSQIKTNKFVDR